MPSVVAPSPVQASLNALTNNYRNSLNELENLDQTTTSAQNTFGDPQTGMSSSFAYMPGSMRRDDSLVDLAMIPLAEEGTESNMEGDASGFSFVDFPFDPNFLAGVDYFNESSPSRDPK